MSADALLIRPDTSPEQVVAQAWTEYVVAMAHAMDKLREYQTVAALFEVRN